MSIITISRGSYSRGKRIAETLAEKLGYECTSRDIILEASEHFNIPEVKLVRAIHDSPSFFDRFQHGKEKYIAFIRETFLENMLKDNIIYHGLAGHFFLRGVPNVLKIRVIANMEDRIKEEMKRENISEKDARYILNKDDEERRKWSLSLYGIDTRDSSLYDIVLHVDNLSTKEGEEILLDIAKRPCFQTTPESQKALKDEYLAAKAYSAIVDKFPKSEVTCKDGAVVVSMETAIELEKDMTEVVKDLLQGIDGITDVHAHVIPYDY